MNSIKKIATLILAICLLIPCFSMVTHAANAIQFDDPTVEMGQTLNVKCVIKSNNSIGDRKVNISYDTSMLKFAQGEHVSETESGKLTYEVTGETGGTRIEVVLSFEVLAEGTTTVKAESYEIKSTSGATLTYTLGTSTIKINPGQENNEPEDEPDANVDQPNDDQDSKATVVIDEKTYTIVDQISADDIPKGFLAATLEIDGVQHRIVKQEESNICLAYLMDESGEGKFFLYVEETASFSPFQQIEISADATDMVITILSYIENITMPEPYELTKIQINGVDFPAWRNTENDDIWIIYAMNSKGEKNFYRYDRSEGTYQKFEPVSSENGIVDIVAEGKLGEVFGDKLNYVIYATGACFVLFVIIIIVLGVKLHNRNAELDELYDEFGIDLEDEEEDEEEEEREFMLIDEDEDEYEEEQIEDSVEIESPVEEEELQTEDDIILVEQEADELETEDDVFILDADAENHMATKDEAEWDFEILFGEDTTEVEKKSEKDDEIVFDEINEENEEEFDFDVDFLDFDE